ncbi:hypothetical protein Ocin01_16111 [Orchesella cincta]|uniref:Uncharacterized protein n=1 Tax=Orchesella cincta TaxID=48709 RepID=A0A1D2MCD0_ORCCI|nr:hypothetical protein Ocin01_16111 [Orchesella cincta]
MYLSYLVGDAAIISTPTQQILQHDSNSKKDVAPANAVANSASSKTQLPVPPVKLDLSPENVTPVPDQAARASRAASTELPLFIQLKAEKHGRMFAPSLIAPLFEKPAGAVSGRAMGDDEEGEQETHFGGAKSTTYYAIRKYSSANSTDRDISGEEGFKNFNNFTANGTKALFAGSMLPPALSFSSLRNKSKLLTGGFGAGGSKSSLKVVNLAQPAEVRIATKLPGFGAPGGLPKLAEVSMGSGVLYKGSANFVKGGSRPPPPPHYITQANDEADEEEEEGDEEGEEDEDDPGEPDQFVEEVGGFKKKKGRKIKKTTTKKTTKTNFTMVKKSGLKRTGVSANLTFRPDGKDVEGRAMGNGVRKQDRKAKPWARKANRILSTQKRKPGISMYPKRGSNRAHGMGRGSGYAQSMGRSYDDEETTSELPMHVVLAAQTGRMFEASILVPKSQPLKDTGGPRGRSMMAEALRETTEKPKRKEVAGAGKHKQDYSDDSTEDIPKPPTVKPKSPLLAPSLLAPKDTKRNGGHG